MLNAKSTTKIISGWNKFIKAQVNLHSHCITRYTFFLWVKRFLEQMQLKQPEKQKLDWQKSCQSMQNYFLTYSSISLILPLQLPQGSGLGGDGVGGRGGDWFRAEKTGVTTCCQVESYWDECLALPSKLKDWDAYNDLKSKLQTYLEVFPLLQNLASKVTHILSSSCCWGGGFFCNVVTVVVYLIVPGWNLSSWEI